MRCASRCNSRSSTTSLATIPTSSCSTEPPQFAHVDSPPAALWLSHGPSGPVRKSMSLHLAVFALRNALRQTLQFALVHHVVGHHPDEQLFHRAAAEALDNLAHGLRCHALRCIEPGVDVGAALYPVLDVALFFKPFQNSSHRRFLHRVPLRESGANIFRCRRAAAPDALHDEMFQF